jgi:hypothetical protein
LQNIWQIYRHALCFLKPVVAHIIGAVKPEALAIGLT